MGKIKSVSRAVDKALDMSHAARMERAREMGFDTSKVYYHGTGSDFDAFREEMGGVYFSESPVYADRYTTRQGESGRNIIPARLRNLNTFDTRKPEHREIYERLFRNRYGNGAPLREDGLPDWVESHDFQEFFKEEGLPFDSAIVGEPPTPMPDGSYRPESSLLVTDESAIRSVNAAFDPAKKGSPNLLAGSAAAAVGLGALQSPEADAMTVAAQDFIQRREARRGEWQARKENLLRTIAEASNTAMSALEMPWRGYLGLSRVGGGLLAGEGLDQALMQGAQMTQQPVETTADQLGGAVVDATGSPALGTAVNVGVNLGGPI